MFLITNEEMSQNLIFYFILWKGTFVLFISLPETCNMPLNCFFPRWWWLMTLISPTWQIIALCKSRWIATQLNFSSRYLFDWSSSSSFPSLAAGKYWNMKSYWFFFSLKEINLWGVTDTYFLGCENCKMRLRTRIYYASE